MLVGCGSASNAQTDSAADSEVDAAVDAAVADAALSLDGGVPRALAAVGGASVATEPVGGAAALGAERASAERVGSAQAMRADLRAHAGETTAAEAVGNTPDAAPGSVDASHDAAPSSAPVQDWIVWGSLGDEHLMSVWVRQAGDVVTLVSSSGGIVVGEGDALYRFRTSERVHAPLGQCDEDGEIRAGRGGRSNALRATLTAIGATHGAPHRSVLVDAYRDRFAAEIDQNITLRGSLGPYLFLEDDVYTYECSAHGNVSSDFVVYDLRTHARSALAEHTAWHVPTVAMYAAARTAIRQELGEDSEGGTFGDEVTQTAFYPRFDEGRVTLMTQLTMESCYACSDGDWSSYTASTQLPLPVLPSDLAPFAPPRAVLETAAFILREIRGVSRTTAPDATLRRAMPDSLVGWDAGC